MKHLLSFVFVVFVFLFPGIVLHAENTTTPPHHQGEVSSTHPATPADDYFSAAQSSRTRTTTTHRQQQVGSAEKQKHKKRKLTSTAAVPRPALPTEVAANVSQHRPLASPIPLETHAVDASASPPPATAPASPNPNAVFIEKDPKGNIIGKPRNPEADTPVEKGTTANGTTESPSNIGATVLQMVFSLAIVLGVAYLVLLGIKKYKYGTMGFRPSGAPLTATTTRVMSVVETLSLGPGRSLQLLKVGQRYILIAQTMQQVTLVHDFGDDVAIQDFFADRDASGLAHDPGFLNALTRLLSQRAPSSTGKQPDDEASQASGISLAQFVQTRQQHHEDRS